MDLILDSIRSIELNLIKILYQNRNDNLSLSTIKKKSSLNCSDKKIEGILRDLMKSDHIMNKKSTFKIKKYKGLYRGMFVENFSIEEIYYFSMINSTNFKLVDDVFKDKFQSVKQFSKNNFISSSSIYNRIKKINSEFGGIIDIQKEKIDNELNTRFFYTKLYLGIFGYLELKFLDEFTRARRYLNSIKFNGNKIISYLSQPQICELTYLIVVTLVRIKQKKFVRQFSFIDNKEEGALLAYIEDDLEVLDFKYKDVNITFEQKMLLLIIVLNIDFTNKAENNKIFNLIHFTCPISLSKAKELVAYSEKKFEYNMDSLERECLLLNLVFWLMKKKLLQNVSTINRNTNYENREYYLKLRYNRLIQLMKEDEVQLMLLSEKTIEELALFFIQYSAIGTKRIKVYLGTMYGRYWDQNLIDRIFTVDLLKKIELCEIDDPEVDLFILDIRISTLEDSKIKLISAIPNSKEICNLHSYLYEQILIKNMRPH